jgi:hypothetical protein
LKKLYPKFNLFEICDLKSGWLKINQIEIDVINKLFLTGKMKLVCMSNRLIKDLKDRF